MTTLVVGANGATGKLLVEQLLERGEEVRIIVRSSNNLSATLLGHKNLTVITANILDLNDSELSQYVTGCDAVASCLGHNLSLKGMFAAPRKLVTDATRRLCLAITNNVDQNGRPEPTKFVLMNTTGNSNRDLIEPISFAQKVVIALLRRLLPPHADNETAADFLRTQINRTDNLIDWSVVRPDALIDEQEPTQFSVHPSPIRSAIFDSGKTSRINVARFMADLITDAETWNAWKSKMPVIYNQV
tara:strand:+ start:1817 stop:2551 length:735 start_codon:yes stop_codon:yes gene_type:complete